VASRPACTYTRVMHNPVAFRAVRWNAQRARISEQALPAMWAHRLNASCCIITQWAYGQDSFAVFSLVFCRLHVSASYAAVTSSSPHLHNALSFVTLEKQHDPVSSSWYSYRSGTSATIPKCVWLLFITMYCCRLIATRCFSLLLVSRTQTHAVYHNEFAN
jgi:hypothetical protein